MIGVMGKTPVDHEAIMAIWREYKATGDRELRNQLMLHYTSLARYVANKVATGLPSSIDRDDLISYGILGLVDAISKFDLTKGVKFETYAITRINGHIIDELRAVDWVPRSIRSKAKDIEKAYTEVERILGRPAEDQEIADHLGISLRELWTLQSQGNVTSVSALDENFDNYDRQSLTDIAFDRTASPEELFDTREILDLMAGAIAMMPPRSKTILVLYYLEELTLREIGEILGVTESRVCQLQSKVLQMLRDSLGQGLAQTAA